MSKSLVMATGANRLQTSSIGIMGGNLRLCYGFTTSSSSNNTDSQTSSTHSKSSQLRVAIVGAPGSGKGTQSAKLERDFGLKSISTGQILRKASTEDTELGRDIKAKLDSGQLLSDDYMFSLVKDYLSKIGSYLLDGFPRTTKQAEALDKWLEERNTPLDFVLYLDVPEEVLIERILDRWIHPASGRVYNSTYKVPKVPGTDDITGEPLVRRSDDNEELKIKDRIETYHRETMPILTHYKNKNKLVTIFSPTSDVGYESILQYTNQYCRGYQQQQQQQQKHTRQHQSNNQQQQQHSNEQKFSTQTSSSTTWRL
ncbi:hypothetical protein SAMD00019534_076600 [Acytostelium subglobosum LB1]|uniref:hypothetical protein n=1 Tax=Acytostelium subglobosum LB1 TaxID=1410327 RepID=UPI000644E0BB|nr:hypothetical protein SAMD00019534_076600 [Acytostelium subglobosum LB1]GAM24485.1 hypothetical protein SAMD00019534_076600 [Acytostelium subglobosum LB1]|eukprot:XP_012752811.1 hypothetical protein SAMD00019534_076600 [Acytostelium subglobosum LB1]